MAATENSNDGKIAVTMELSSSVLDAFMSAGDDWQACIDAALKDWLKNHSPADIKI